MPEYAKFHGCRHVIEKYRRLFVSCLGNVLKSMLMVVAHGLSEQHGVASLFRALCPNRVWTSFLVPHPCFQAIPALAVWGSLLTLLSMGNGDSVSKCFWEERLAIFFLEKPILGTVI